jgi:GGDEF domain-containing protein
VVSTSSAAGGYIALNTAIVPSQMGKIDALAEGTSHWILSTSSCFAPRVHRKAPRNRPFCSTRYTLARTGGEEFTVLAEVADAQGVKALVSALEVAFALPSEVEGKQITAGVSGGMALYPDDGHTVDELRAVADKVMYLAKHAKRR